MIDHKPAVARLSGLQMHAVRSRAVWWWNRVVFAHRQASWLRPVRSARARSAL